MPSKRVRLYIDSDASGVQKGVGQAQRSLRGFENQAKRTSSVMGGLSTGASSLGLAFGAAGLAVGIRGSIDAFKEQEKSSARVIATLKTLGVNTDAVRKKIQDVTTAQAKLSGFQDEDLQASFSTILRVTKDVNESLRLNALAMDIARGSGKDLNVVATAIAKVADGNAGALARYGVRAEKGATATDVLAKAQARYAGQAKEFGNTAAGAAEKANTQINELQESVGRKLAPAMESAANATLKLAGATGSFVDHAGGVGPLIAGAAGFGAFKTIAPSIANASSAVGALGKVAGRQGAGTSMRVLGSAVAASVSPMTAAAVGAGLLAAGLYEINHNAESADQAVQGLNATFQNVGAAKQQVDVARAAVNTSRDYVNTTREAEAAARSKARSLRADIASLQDSGASQSKVNAKTKEWQKALKDVVPAVHARQSAEVNLKSSQRNLAAAIDGVREAQTKMDRKSRDVAAKAQADGAIYDRVSTRWGTMASVSFDAAHGAEVLAGRLSRAGERARDASGDTKKFDDALAGFIKRTQRIPSQKEFKLISNYVHNGLSVDRVVNLLAGINSKDVTVRVRAQVDERLKHPFRQFDPVTGKPLATGGRVAGAYSAGDRVPALLAGEEVVLNPRQQALVGGGMSIDQALDATGAPTIGFGFAGGRKAPGSRGGAASENARGGSATSTAGLIAARIEKALNSRSAAWNFAQAKTQLGIARADGDAGASVAAYEAELAGDTARQAAIERILKNPAKALGIPGARLTRQQRTDLLDALAATLGEIKDDKDTIYGLRHPSADDSGAGSTDVGTSTAVDVSPDLQARLDQAIAQTAVATRGQRLSDAAVAALGSTGDIGTGNYANAFTAARGGPILALGDVRSLQAIAAGAVEGMGMQAGVAANRATVNI